MIDVCRKIFSLLYSEVCDSAIAALYLNIYVAGFLNRHMDRIDVSSIKILPEPIKIPVPEPRTYDRVNMKST